MLAHVELEEADGGGEHNTSQQLYALFMPIAIYHLLKENTDWNNTFFEDHKQKIMTALEETKTLDVENLKDVVKNYDFDVMIRNISTMA